MSQARVERERIYQAVGDVGLGTGIAGAGGGAAFGATTTISAYPTQANAWYAIQRHYLDGTQVEGDPAIHGSNGAPPFLSYNVGTKIPPPGTPILSLPVGGKWVFRYDG